MIRPIEINGTQVREIDGRLIVDNDPAIDADFLAQQVANQIDFEAHNEATKEWAAKRFNQSQAVFQAALSPPPPRIEPAPPVADTAPTEQQAKPLQRQRAQEASILEAVRKLELDPLALPRNKPGKSGAKAAVKSYVTANRKDLFTGVKVFDKAWERMSGSGEIVLIA